MSSGAKTVPSTKSTRAPHARRRRRWRPDRRTPRSHRGGARGADGRTARPAPARWSAAARTRACRRSWGNRRTGRGDRCPGGRIVTARPDNDHRDLFYGFPNSYGTLGYALRLTIELEPVAPYVHLRHVRHRDATAAFAHLAAIGAGGKMSDSRGRIAVAHVAQMDVRRDRLQLDGQP